jgi:hypothetical protein
MDMSKFDSFSEMIFVDEVCRCGKKYQFFIKSFQMIYLLKGSGGLTWGLFEGMQIGLPPILNFGSEFLKNKVTMPCLNVYF